MIYRKANRPWHRLGGCEWGVRSAPVPGVGAARLSREGTAGPASERDALAPQGTACPSRAVVFNYVAKLRGTAPGHVAPEPHFAWQPCSSRAEAAH